MHLKIIWNNDSNVGHFYLLEINLCAWEQTVLFNWSSFYLYITPFSSLLLSPSAFLFIFNFLYFNRHLTEIHYMLGMLLTTISVLILVHYFLSIFYSFVLVINRVSSVPRETLSCSFDKI